jgi:uncharacterized protein (TIGR00369 family)
MTMPFKPEISQATGLFSAGALIQLADTAATWLCHLRLRASGAAEGAFAFAVQISSNLVGNTDSGSATADARLVSVGRTVMVSQTEVRDDDGRALLVQSVTHAIPSVIRMSASTSAQKRSQSALESSADDITGSIIAVGLDCRFPCKALLLVLSSHCGGRRWGRLRDLSGAHLPRRPTGELRGLSGLARCAGPIGGAPHGGAHRLAGDSLWSRTSQGDRAARA